MCGWCWRCWRCWWCWRCWRYWILLPEMECDSVCRRTMKLSSEELAPTWLQWSWLLLSGPQLTRGGLGLWGWRWSMLTSTRRVMFSFIKLKHVLYYLSTRVLVHIIMPLCITSLNAPSRFWASIFTLTKTWKLKRHFFKNININMICVNSIVRELYRTFLWCITLLSNKSYIYIILTSCISDVVRWCIEGSTTCEDSGSVKCPCRQALKQRGVAGRVQNFFSEIWRLAV